MLASATTLVHLAISSVTRALKASGVVGRTSAPSARNRCNDLRLRQDRLHLGVDLLNEIGRQPRGPGNAQPAGHRIALQSAFSHRRHVGQGEEARRPGDRDRAHPSVAQERQQELRRVHLEIDALGNQVGDRLRRTAIGNMLNFQRAHRHQQLGRQMHAGAVAGGRIGQLAGVCLRGLDDIRDGLGRVIRIGHQDKRIFGEHADEAEVVHRVVGELLVHRGRHRMTARQDGERASVRRGARHRRGRSRAAGARPRFHHDGLTETLGEMLGDEARRDIDVRAGREAVHQRDRTRGLRARRDRSEGRKAGQSGAAGDCRHGCSSPIVP